MMQNLLKGSMLLALVLGTGFFIAVIHHRQHAQSSTIPPALYHVKKSLVSQGLSPKTMTQFQELYLYFSPEIADNAIQILGYLSSEKKNGLNWVLGISSQTLRNYLFIPHQEALSQQGVEFALQKYCNMHPRLQNVYLYQSDSKKGFEAYVTTDSSPIVKANKGYLYGQMCRPASV